MKEISSSQNPYIKSLLQLQEKSKIRKKTAQFLIEGQREIELAANANYQIKTILFNAAIFNEDKVRSLGNPSTEFIRISDEVYQKLAYRDSTEGILAVAESKKHDLISLKLTENPLILVAEAPEKPGNIGALLRTADAANLDAVIIANPKSDLYNPNIVRSSVGCVFSVQIATASTAEIIEFLKSKKIDIYAAALQESTEYFLQDFTKGSAIVVGTEATGLTQEWRDAAKQNIIIPMEGQIDSMNVSVAAAVLLFEAKRQRR